MCELPGTSLWFRGPRPQNLKSGEYFVCLGAAQTFGCFCEKPYPRLLEESLCMQVLNLGYGGAGPLFFLEHQPLHDYLNRAKFVIIQVMSGRSEDNELFYSGGNEYLTRRSDGRKLGATASYREILEESFNSFWPFNKAKRLGHILAAIFDQKLLKQLFETTRHNWVLHMNELLSLIHPPVILFWYSRRGLRYWERYNNINKALGKFPQLVTHRMIKKIHPNAEEFVQCVTNRGTPQALFSRFTGKPVRVDPARDRLDLGGQLWSYNYYYPSPEMHQDAAEVLLPTCRKYL